MELQKQTTVGIYVVAGGVLLAVILAIFITNIFPEERDAVAKSTGAAPLIDFSALKVGANIAELERGRVYYAQLCSSCHGAQGKGFGEWAYRVKPRPSNLTSRRVQQRSDEYLFNVISEGQVSSPMKGWKDQLTERQRWQIVGYLRYLSVHQSRLNQVES